MQNYNRRANVDWDEAVADILGYRVYKDMYHGEAGFDNYVTPYNTYCMCVTRAKTYFGNVYGRLNRNPTDRAKLPSPVCEAIGTQQSKNVALNLAKVAVSEILVKSLTEDLFTWYFNGPGIPISQGHNKPMVNIDTFLVRDKLDNMFAVSNVLQSYDGHNTMRAI